MNIGIIVHSSTGNTYSVVQKLNEKLLAAGHSVNIERISPLGSEKTYNKDITLAKQADVSSYDALVFGAPVQGASVSPVMSACLAQIGSLKNKKVACLVTQAFPFPWMGGNRAISQMKKLCESKGATVRGTGIVNWMNLHREKSIADTVENLSRLFGI